MLEVCPGYTDKTTLWLISASMIDCMVKLPSVIDQTCFEFIDVSYFGAVNFLPQNTPDDVLLNKPHFGSLYAK